MPEDLIRATLERGGTETDGRFLHDLPYYVREPALAALDALVADRDKWKAIAAPDAPVGLSVENQNDLVQAEAERDRLAAALQEAKQKLEAKRAEMLAFRQDCIDEGSPSEAASYGHKADAYRVAIAALAGVGSPPAIPGETLCKCGHAFAGYHLTPGTECAARDCDCGRFEALAGVVLPDEPEQA